MEQLRCLVNIAQTHSITNTAQNLFLTQQTVSSRIKQLEQDLGIKVLVRTNSGVHLTPDGEEIVAYAKQILNTETAIKQICQSKQTKQDYDTFNIRVCSTSSVTNIVLPDIIAKLNAQQKKVSLKIGITNDLDDLFYQVQEQICDIGFFTYNETELPRKHEAFTDFLQIEILARDELVAVMDRKFQKDGQMVLPAEAYQNHIITLYNIVSIDGSKKTSQQETMVTSNDADFHRRMIEKTGAIVLMPSLAYQYFFNSKKYIALPLELGNVPLIHGAVYRKDASRLMQEFVAMTRHELYIK